MTPRLRYARCGTNLIEVGETQVESAAAPSGLSYTTHYLSMTLKPREIQSVLEQVIHFVMLMANKLSFRDKFARPHLMRLSQIMVNHFFLNKTWLLGLGTTRPRTSYKLIQQVSAQRMCKPHDLLDYRNKSSLIENSLLQLRAGLRFQYVAVLLWPCHSDFKTRILGNFIFVKTFSVQLTSLIELRSYCDLKCWRYHGCLLESG